MENQQLTLDHLWKHMGFMRKKPPLYPRQIYRNNPYQPRIEGIAFIQRHDMQNITPTNTVRFFL